MKTALCFLFALTAINLVAVYVNFYILDKTINSYIHAQRVEQQAILELTAQPSHILPIEKEDLQQVEATTTIDIEVNSIP